MRQALLCVAVAASALLTGGCGGGKGKVKGKVVENGQPMKFDANTAAVELTPMGSDGKPDKSKSFTTPVEADGGFEVLASGGQLPPGKYNVSLLLFQKLKGKSKKLEPPNGVEREVKAGPNDFTLDMAKGE